MRECVCVVDVDLCAFTVKEEVVRCRDCRYFERGGTLTVAGHEHKMLNNCHRHTYDGGYTCISPDENDFCAWGERRTDA